MFFFIRVRDTIEYDHAKVNKQVYKQVYKIDSCCGTFLATIEKRGCLQLAGDESRKVLNPTIAAEFGLGISFGKVVLFIDSPPLLSHNHREPLTLY